MEELHYYLEYLGNCIELPLGETVIGRDIGCKLRFNDAAVSRRHLRFIRRTDEVFLEDLQSSNGTRLNGKLLTQPQRLADGDAIMVGGRTVFIRISAGEQPTSQTLNLHEVPIDARHVSVNVNVRARTQPMAAVTIPPEAKQRCPNCGQAVNELEDECKSCHYQWGGFRTTSPTDVRGIARRRHERHAIELQIVYISSELEIEAVSRDLSQTGVFVCSQVLDPVGTACKLTILVDGGPPLEVEGVVRRVVAHHEGEQAGLGVEFSRVGPAARAWLDALIAAQAK